MRKLLESCACLFLLMTTVSSGNLYAQYFEIHEASQDPYKPKSLIENYFLGEGVEVIEVKYAGTESATGLFTGGQNEIGIDRGIIISTGKVKAINNPFSEEASTVTSTDTIQDSQIEDLSGHSIVRDISSYEITFIPTSEIISFNYVFASEEYPDYVCSPFNDVFGFFISGPSPDGIPYNDTNIAFVPNSNEQTVSINNVNNGHIGIYGNPNNCQAENLSNNQFYTSNQSQHLVFNGVLERFSASISVIPCQTYTMKFIVADVRDELLDSAVFLEAKSFTSNDLSVQAVTLNSNGLMIEGCKNGTLNFVIEEVRAEDYIIPFELLGQAKDQIDFEISEYKAIIPSGELSSTIHIQALEDSEEEGIEELGIKLQKNQCSDEVIWIAIDDNRLEEPAMQEDYYLCEPREITLDASVNLDIPEPKIFTNNNQLEIFPETESIFSEIEVSGIYPSALAQSTFSKVCIDDLEHPWIEDLDIFLFGPDGQFIELTSDNGADGGNTVSSDYYRNTCFTLKAENKIYGNSPEGAPASMVPFSGEFLPEGSWDDFIGNANFQTNGTWRLMLIDDYATGVGRLNKWSIHFETIYDLSYQWSPAIGLSCTDCPKPIAFPQSDQSYDLKISDSNGCEIHKQINFDFNANLKTPVLYCDNSNSGSILFSWEKISDAEEYLVSINGSDFISIGLLESYLYENLTAGEEINFQIFAKATCRESNIAEIICESSECRVLNFDVQFIDAISCPGASDASVQITSPQIMNQDLIFSIGSIENKTGYFDQLLAGSYTVFISDENDCDYKYFFEIPILEELNANATSSPEECDGDVLGKIELNPEGGTAPYQYSWTGGLTTQNIYNLDQGTYQLTLTDDRGCTLTESFIIESIASYQVLANLISPTCPNDEDGAIHIEIEGQSMDAVTINWEEGYSGTDLLNLAEGQYHVNVSDEKGCEINQVYELSSSAEINLNLSIDSITCFGANDGNIFANIDANNLPIEVNWSTGIKNEELLDLKSGLYKLTIVDSKGCTYSEEITLSEPEELSLEIEELIHPVCEGFPEVSINLNSSGGTGIHTYRLNDSPFDQMSFLSNIQNGEHHIEVKDQNGCLEVFEKTIALEAKVPIKVEIEDQGIVSLGQEIKLSTKLQNEFGEVHYYWQCDTETDLSCLNCPEPTFKGTNLQTVSVEVIDQLGCTSKDYITIKFDKDKPVYFPTVFSPNGDNINDFYRPYIKEDILARVVEFSIYDRFGEKIFTDKDFIPNEAYVGWNGSFKTKALNPGVYTWYSSIEFIDGQIQLFQGNLSLIK